MTALQCYYVQLVTLYSKRILYGIKCDLKGLYADIINTRRLIRIELSIETCQLNGIVIDELNKFKRKLTSTYSLTCTTCN